MERKILYNNAKFLPLPTTTATVEIVVRKERKRAYRISNRKFEKHFRLSSVKRTMCVQDYCLTTAESQATKVA